MSKSFDGRLKFKVTADIDQQLAADVVSFACNNNNNMCVAIHMLIAKNGLESQRPYKKQSSSERSLVASAFHVFRCRSELSIMPHSFLRSFSYEDRFYIMCEAYKLYKKNIQEIPLFSAEYENDPSSKDDKDIIGNDYETTQDIEDDVEILLMGNTEENDSFDVLSQLSESLNSEEMVHEIDELHNEKSVIPSEINEHLRKTNQLESKPADSVIVSKPKIKLMSGILS